MADGKLTLEVTANTRDAEQNLRRLADAEQGLESSSSKLALAVTGVNQAIELAQKAFSFGANAAGQFFQAMDRAAVVEGLAKGFDNLQASVGNTASKTLPALRDATKGLITDFELMKSANQAVLLGVDDGSGKFTDLTAAAIKLGDAMGITAKEAVDSLTVGIGRQSKLILDNLGVVVDAEGAYENYAASIKKTVEQLTEQERKIAFNTAAFEAINTKAGELGEKQETAAVATIRFNVALANMSDEFVTALSSNTELGTALNNLTKAFSEIPIKETAEQLGKLIAILVNLSAEVVKITGKIATLVTWNDNLNLGFKSIATLLKQTLRGEVANFDTVVAELAKEIQNTSEHTDIFVKGPGQKLKRTIEEAVKPSEELTKAFEGIDNAIRDLTGVSKFPELQRQIDSIFRQDYEGTLDGAGIVSALERLKTEAGLSVEELEAIPELIKKISGEYEKLSELGSSGDSSKKKGGFFGFDLGFDDSLEASLAQAVGQAVGNVVDALATGKTLHGQDYKKLYQDLSSSAANAVLPGSGPIAGAISGKVFDVFDSIFGGNKDPDNNARKGIGKYFNELLKDQGLAVVIEGRLTELFSFDRLDSNAFNDGSFAEKFGELSTGAQEAFGGVGNALNELLGDGRDIGSQIAFILSENVGGSLNALQLLLQEVGISAEQAGAAVIESFKQGELSAIEVETSLRGIRDVFADGIPGAVGATNEALQNLRASAGRGIASLDALKDIFFEAAEVGVDSFEELRQSLLDQGASIEDVDALFAALEQRGVTAFEQITQAADEQLIGILAELQSQGKFAFDDFEARIKDAERVIDSLSQDREVNIKVNVKTSYDAGAQQLQRAGILDNPNNISPGIA